MARFSDEAWQRTAALREAIHRLPFNTELAAGLLSRERFQTYIIQDAIYLGRFSRALAISAAKAPDAATTQSFAQSPSSRHCTAGICGTLAWSRRASPMPSPRRTVSPTPVI
jgi:thiaminase